MGRHQWQSRAGDASKLHQATTDPAVAQETARLQVHGVVQLRGMIKALGLRPCGRTKEALALRLARALRAERVSSQQLASNLRFDTKRAGRVIGALDACRLCTGPVAPPRRSFCCDECVHFHLILTSGSHVRKALAIRDDGVSYLSNEATLLIMLTAYASFV